MEPDEKRPPKRSAYTAGLTALAQRERSTHELRRHLIRKGYAVGDVEVAVARLLDHGALDDRRAAAALVRRQRRLGRSTSRIRGELAAQGFAPDVMRETLDTLHGTAHDAEALSRAVARLAPTLSRPEAVVKAMQRLHRRGFALSDIKAAMGALAIGTPDAGDD